MFLFFQLKALDVRQRAMQEELSSALFYTRLTLFLTLITAFCVFLTFFWFSESYQNDTGCSTFQETPPVATMPPITKINEEL